MSERSVLYDAPGPRARRTTLIVSVVVFLGLAGAAYLVVYLPLAERGQFTMDKWGPLVDPTNEYFPQVWRRLWQGLLATFQAAGLAVLASLVCGTLLAVLRMQLRALTRRRFTGLAAPLAVLLRALSWFLNVVTRFCVEVFRGTPVVITIFFVWRGFPALGLDFGATMWDLVIGLTIYNMVVIAEILRSGMQGLPTGQHEAASAIGLSSFQTTRTILLPQAFRIMLPALISQLVVVLKDTSLGYIIGYQEVLSVGRQLARAPQLANLLQMFFVVGVVYILANYLLSRTAQYVERRVARGRTTAALGRGPRPVATTELMVPQGPAEPGGEGRPAPTPPGR
jgi:glutamate transport system permease protein